MFAQTAFEAGSIGSCGAIRYRSMAAQLFDNLVGRNEVIRQTF